MSRRIILGIASLILLVSLIIVASVLTKSANAKIMRITVPDNQCVCSKPNIVMKEDSLGHLRIALLNCECGKVQCVVTSHMILGSSTTASANGLGSGIACLKRGFF